MAYRTRCIFLEQISGWQSLNRALGKVLRSLSRVADSRGHSEQSFASFPLLTGFTVGEVSVSDKAACTYYTPASSC